MLSTSSALLPEPETQVVMWPPPPGVPMATISPVCTIDCQLLDCPEGPLNATIHSPLAWPGIPIAVLCTGSEAPASAAIVLANTQQPFMFHAWPMKLMATEAIELGVACEGTAPVNDGSVATV